MLDLYHTAAEFWNNHSHNILHDYGYIAILLVTFLEGESIVIVAGVLAYRGEMDFGLIVATAMLGSFLGDQLYFTLGQVFGTPMLKRFPGLEKRIAWAFGMVRRHETLFILSFRFVYGIRNISPFVIAMAGVPRLRFASLNVVAAALWAVTFTLAGYYFGKAVKVWFGEYENAMLGVIAGLVALGLVIAWVRRRHSKKHPVAAPQSADTV